MSSTAPQPGSSRLTAEQTRALEVLTASVALGAGAGCGKTTVLTERFLQALGDGGSERNPLATIVALTFTVKAARELRQRIRGACHERLSAASPEQAPFWRGILRSLEIAPISTFHEYCTGLLRRHALEVGLDPDFEVLDESLASALRTDALTRQIRRWLAEQHEDLILAAAEFGLGQVRALLDRLVSGRDSDRLDEWVELTPAQLVGSWETAWNELCRPRLVADVIDAGRSCHDWLLTQSYGNARLESRRMQLLDWIPLLCERVDDRAWLTELREAAKLNGHRASQWPSEADYAETKRRFEALRDAIDAWWKKGRRDDAATLHAAETGLCLARLASEARRAYHRVKSRRGGLDFDDLILRTRDLLARDPERIRDDPQRPIEFVLVDEFQDTDPAQSQILRSMTGQRFGGGGLFIVGDFKQSIYRFRGARPALFREYRSAFPETGRLELSENFRSHREVIDFVNALFVDAFPGEQPRLRGGFALETPAPVPAVEFVWPIAENADEDETRLSASELRAVEARWLARILRERLESGWLVRDRKSGPSTMRPAHAGDVAFLFRAMTEVVAYERALVAEGFDVYIVGGAAFYAQQEIQDVVNVLAVIDDPFDDVSLAGALRSPFFGVSDIALYQLATVPGSCLYSALAICGDRSEFAKRDRSRIDRARRFLEGWRTLKDRVPVAALIERILDESGYEAALAGEYLGDRKRANARKLVRIARRFDARPGFSLSQVVARFRQDLLEPPREGEAATTDEEGTSIRLMSIHQSKGLEFPIVVIPDLNRKRESVRGTVAFDPDLGPLVRSSRSVAEVQDAGGSGVSRGWSVYESIENEEARAESIRLFYVATTRARDALLLSAGGGPEARPTSEAIELLAGRFDRATGECLATLPEGWPAPRVGVIASCPASASVVESSRSRRQTPGALARLIASAPRRPPDNVRQTAQRPRNHLVDLEELTDPVRESARLARLLRCCLGEPDLRTAQDLHGVVHRVGRRQVPRAHSPMIDEIIERLGPWLDGWLGPRLGSATDIERNVAWTLDLSGPSRTDPSVVVSGWTDLLIRDGDGVWSIGIVSAPGASRAHEEVRLQASAQAALERGLAPLGAIWRIDLDSAELRLDESFERAKLLDAVRALEPIVDSES